MYYGHDAAVGGWDLELLIGLRPEQYRYERAFKLFQLQSAIIFPDDEKAKTDGWIIAAAKLLDAMEDDIFCGEEDAKLRESNPGDPVGIDLGERPTATVHRINTLLQHREYRRLYDRVFAHAGGLTAAVDTTRPVHFDAAVEKRKEKIAIAAGVVEFLARAVENGIAEKEVNVTRALFFHWWPTSNEPTTRGRRGSNTISPKTFRGYWNKFASSASFIYALARSEVDLYPPPCSAAAFDFAENLEEQARDVDGLRRFLGLCASVQDRLLRANLSSRDFLLIPETIPRADHRFPPFTPEELLTIRDYEVYHFRMSE